MKKQTIHLNEQQFKEIVKECLKTIVENFNDFDDVSRLYNQFPIGGEIVYRSENGTTGGKLMKIFPFKGDLAFTWSNDRGVLVDSHPRTLGMLAGTSYPVGSAPANLIGNDGEGWRILDANTGKGYGYASYTKPQGN